MDTIPANMTQVGKLRPPLSDEDRAEVLALLGPDAMIASIGEMANPWHDALGKFAPKGVGTASPAAQAFVESTVPSMNDAFNAHAEADEAWRQIRRDNWNGDLDAEEAAAEARVRELEKAYSDVRGQAGDDFAELSDEDLRSLVGSEAKFDDPYVYGMSQWAEYELRNRDKIANPPPPPAPDRQRMPGTREAYESLVTQAGFDDPEYYADAFDNGQRYGSLLSDWNGEGYKAVQSALLNHRDDDHYAQPIIDAFDEAMIQAPTNLTLYRGMYGADKLNVGDSLSTPMYQAATTDPVVAMAFTKSPGAVTARPRVDESYPVLRVNVPQGARILPLPESPAEQEVVIHRDSQMTVTGRSTMETPDGTIEVIDVDLSST